MIELPLEPLSAVAFAPFGDVISKDTAARHYPINGGTTERFHDLATLDPGPEGRVIVSIFRGQARVLPMAITMMERHPLGSQAFIPLGTQAYLVVVAAATLERPQAGDLRAFLATAAQGVNYARGVWHHPLLALHETSDFLVLDRSGPGNNCDEVSLTPAAHLALT